MVDEEFFSNGSTELHDAITGIKLFWGHRGLENVHEETATALAANGGGPVMLWAPEEFVEGTSISHLDEDAYPTGTPNALMSPFVSRGKVTHQPGPVLLAMLHDMGYTIREPSAADSAIWHRRHFELRCRRYQSLLNRDSDGGGGCLG